MLKSVSKTGRPQGEYRASWGEKIVGLRRLKDGRWRTSHPKQTTFSEPDERLAVARFRRWQAAQEDERLTFPLEQQPSGSIDEAYLAARTAAAKSGYSRLRIRLAPGVEPEYSVVVASPQFYLTVRHMLLTEPKRLAEGTGIEQLGYLSNIQKPVEAPTMNEVGALYAGTKAKLSNNWLSKVKLFWSEFADAVGVRTLRDLTQEQVVDYADLILNEVREGRQTPTYARQRFGAIKTVINYPPKRGKWAEDCARASAFCKVLVPPRKSAVNPRPITPEDFNALLEASGPTMKALLLLMLNGCMYAKEAAAVTWAELDLAKKTLVSARSKTGVVRVAVLWGRTIEALRALPVGDKRAVFAGETGMPMGYLEAYRRFKPVRKQSKLPTAQLSQIRDGSYTAAIEAGVDLNIVKLLAGHATGISDHYLKRRPTMVAAACRAIEEAYFG